MLNGIFTNRMYINLKVIPRISEPLQNRKIEFMKILSSTKILIALTLAIPFLFGCGDGSDSALSKQTLNGAGASFPAPVYQMWTYSYSESTPNIKINYQSIGSGSGLNQIKAATIDFAGSDNPLKPEDLEKEGLIQFPMLTGGVVVIVNIPGIPKGKLKLSQKVLAQIFLGEITQWNNPEIQKLNPDLKLPNLKVSVVRRSDGSGTTFIFTNYLSKISKEWKTKVGEGSSVNWPVGIGGQKNPGVCNNVSKIAGSIGYTEFTYAIESKIDMPILENADGKFVSPSLESFMASAQNAPWLESPGFYTILTQQPGAQSWPITGVTYILMRKDLADNKKKELINYFNWCFKTGSKSALDLQYAPIPENIQRVIQEKVFQ